MDDELYHRVLNLAYFYLKFRPRTKKEVIDYLVKKSPRFHFDQKIIEQVINELLEEDLVNDENFVSWFVEQRSHGKPKGRFALIAELLRFGIQKDLIDEYFEKNELDEDTLAYQALSRRWSLWSTLPHEKRYQKAVAFLSRRGFNFDIIRKAIDVLQKT
jgi:regulatory protein